MTGENRPTGPDDGPNRSPARPDDIERLLAEGAVPTRGDEPVFDAPWQARAFGLAVALARSGAYDWSTFQRSLIAELDDDSLAVAESESTADDPENSAEREYYERWVDALVEVLRRREAVTSGELDERTEAFATGRRDASEFTVGGDPHGRGKKGSSRD